MVNTNLEKLKSNVTSYYLNELNASRISTRCCECRLGNLLNQTFMLQAGNNKVIILLSLTIEFPFSQESRLGCKNK